MRCGPAEPGRCAAEGCAPPARGPAPARHSPGERRSAAEDAVPRLVNRACLRSNQTLQINNWGETTPRHPLPTAQTRSSSTHPGTATAPSGALTEDPGGTEPRGSTAALRQARGTGERRFPPGCPRGSRTRESLPHSRPSEARCGPCARPPQPLTLATRLESTGTARLFPCVQTRRLQVLSLSAFARYTVGMQAPTCARPPRPLREVRLLGRATGCRAAAHPRGTPTATGSDHRAAPLCPTPRCPRSCVTHLLPGQCSGQSAGSGGCPRDSCPGAERAAAAAAGAALGASPEPAAGRGCSR